MMRLAAIYFGVALIDVLVLFALLGIFQEAGRPVVSFAVALVAWRLVWLQLESWRETFLRFRDQDRRDEDG